MGRVAETKSLFSPLRGIGVGCSGSVVEGVSSADEWVQEAVMSDIFQHEPDRKNKQQQPKKSHREKAKHIGVIY